MNSRQFLKRKDWCNTMTNKEILVLAEQNYGNIHPVTYELIGKALELSEKTGSKVSCLLVGPEGLPIEEICYRGASPVYYMADKCFGDADEMLYKENIVFALKKIRPEMVLIGATNFGRSLAPRIAGALETGLTADCTDLKVDTDGRIIQIRPAFSDNILAHIKTTTDPQMATIRYKEFSEAERDPSRETDIRMMEPHVTDPVVEVLDTIELGGVDITKAEVIVAAGRGFKKKEDLVLAQDLADALGGVMAASRALVDAGMVTSRIQVGYSGHRVKPKVYIACGISGAPQHIAGMKESAKIIAINSDPSAPIFKLADMGYVGDLYEILPRLTERFRKERRS